MKKFWHKLALSLALISTANFVCAAQTAATQDCPEEKIKAEKTKLNHKQFAVDFTELRNEDQTTEKAIETDPKVNVSFCASAPELTVTGWERNEVRVIIENGGKVNFKIRERNDQNKPLALFLINGEAKPNASYGECLQGRKIEIEMPETSSVSIKSVKSNSGVFSFDSLAKVIVSNIDADVRLSNITEEIAVSSWQGSLAAEDSSGNISLKTVGGDIAAYRLKPNDFSNVLKLSSTSGAVNLRDVKHKNIEATATNGDLTVLNSLVNGGSYDFNTTNGSVLLQLPADFPFQFNATLLEGGNFQTNFPFKTTSQSVTGQARRITGTNGTADTTINMTSFKGVLWLKKK